MRHFGSGLWIVSCIGHPRSSYHSLQLKHVKTYPQLPCLFSEIDRALYSIFELTKNRPIALSSPFPSYYDPVEIKLDDLALIRSVIPFPLFWHQAPMDFLDA